MVSDLSFPRLCSFLRRPARNHTTRDCRRRPRPCLAERFTESGLSPLMVQLRVENNAVQLSESVAPPPSGYRYQRGNRVSAIMYNDIFFFFLSLLTNVISWPIKYFHQYKKFIKGILVGQTA
jgi:hypothetical protein